MPEPRANNLQGKVALVTGASSGIGRSIAVQLAGEGVRVGLFARRKGQLEAVSKECGGDSLVLVGDVRNPDDIQSAVRKAIDRWGGIDILVNNAGIYKSQTLLDTKQTEWEAIIDTNLTGPFLFMQAVLPHMLKKGLGSVVNISSVAGIRSFADCAPYCASKFGLVGFSRAVRKELRAKGIRVILVHPGSVATDIWRAAGEEGDVDLSSMLSPEDVAGVVLSALKAPPHALHEDLVITPIGGDI